MIFRNKVLASLPPDDMAALRAGMRELALTKGQVLYEPGDRATSVYFPSTAVLSEVVIFEDGRAIESATLGAEGASGLLLCLTDTRCFGRVFAQVAGGVIAVDGAALRARAMHSPVLHQTLLRHIEIVHLQAQQSVACMACHDAPQRLARWLLMTADRAGAETFTLTQDYLAVMVGVQRTTINAAAGELRRLGAIEYTRGAISVTDRPLLERQACECYAVLRDRVVEVIGDAPLPSAA